MTRSLVALKHKGELPEGTLIGLDSPRVGVFRAALGAGDAVREGRVLGRLTVLGRVIEIVAPAVAGAVLWIEDATAVQYGQELVRLGSLSAGGAAEAAQAAQATSGGYAVRAPIDGIFYTRPSPDSPHYVRVGSEVSTGQTLGLIEVMKTFNPVVLGGVGAPKRGRVVALEATDSEEVGAGEVLLRIEPL